MTVLVSLQLLNWAQSQVDDVSQRGSLHHRPDELVLVEDQIFHRRLEQFLAGDEVVKVFFGAVELRQNIAGSVSVRWTRTCSKFSRPPLPREAVQLQPLRPPQAVLGALRLPAFGCNTSSADPAKPESKTTLTSIP